MRIVTLYLKSLGGAPVVIETEDAEVTYGPSFVVVEKYDEDGNGIGSETYNTNDVLRVTEKP